MADPTIHPATDNEPSFPRRRVWLRVSVLAAGLFLAAFFAVRIWAVVRLEGMLARVAADHRARGEPVTAADFEPKAMADEQNAAFYLMRAATALKLNPEDELLIWQGDLIPKAGGFRLPDEAPALLARNDAILTDIRRARGCSQTTWRFDMRGWIESAVPEFGAQRTLATFSKVAAIAAHKRGDESSALEYCRDIGAIANALDQPPILLCHLNANGIRRIQTQAIRAIAADLLASDDAETVTSVRASQPATRPAVRSQVTTVIQELLDDKRILAAAADALASERVLTAEIIADGARGEISPIAALALQKKATHGPRRGAALLLYPLRPLFLMDMVMVERDAREARRAYAAPDAAQATAILRQASLGGGQPLIIPAAWQPLVWMPRAVAMQTQLLADRHSAAIALAARLHVLDIEHGLAARDSTDWIAQYLGRWPDDPRAGAGTPMAYPGTAPAGVAATTKTTTTPAR